MSYFDIWNTDLDKLNSMTKYPSILTYHAMGERGRLQEDTLTMQWPNDADITLTEKINGTNSRMVFTPDGEVLFGSREEWLGHIGDLVYNKNEGIVDALYDIAAHVNIDSDIIGGFWEDERYGESIVTCYIETYGGTVGDHCKDYSGDRRVGIRLFDVSVINNNNYEELLAMPIEKIASWREHGGQQYMTEDELQEFSRITGLALTPRLGNVNSDKLPYTFLDCMYFTNEYTPVSQCTLDAGARGGSEGIVLRTPDRKFIAKMRREDYSRSMRAK